MDLVEPPAAGEELAHDQEGPPLTEDLQSLRHRAELPVATHIGHGRPRPDAVSLQIQEWPGPATGGDAGAMTVWALGDYPRLAREVLAGLGPRLVRACAVRPGQRVLDVGTGSGLVAFAAAGAGADVVGADVSPELLAAARGTPGGAAVEWVFADAQRLPFADGEFDAVLSCVGAVFAPDQRATAGELLRVCRPGGTIGMVNWTPAGSVGRFFDVFGGSPVTAWGEPGHVRSLFGEGVSALTTTEETLPVTRFTTAAQYCAYYKEHFGPVVAAFADAADPAGLDRRFLAYAEAELRGGLGLRLPAGRRPPGVKRAPQSSPPGGRPSKIFLHSGHTGEPGLGDRVTGKTSPHRATTIEPVTALSAILSLRT